MRQCSNCKFFVKEEPTHCRFLPPAAIDQTNSAYALTRKEFWCAMHTFSWRAILRMIFRFGRPAE